MLIRSQNKQNLINMDTINTIYCCGTNNSNIYAESLSGDCLLGVYSTKEKALKVLDIIEARINEPIYINDEGNGEYAKYFHSSFHMPQDDEV